MSGKTSTKVLIIGAGISGLSISIHLKKHLGLKDFVVVEKSAGIGGTWFDNRYPGACCDVWSHLYSFAEEPNTHWTREYPDQAEILEYLVSVAAKWELYKNITFNTQVVKSKWNNATSKWDVTVKICDGSKEGEYVKEYVISADFVVSAIGQLNYPAYPQIPGMEDFKGRMMHSARWDNTMSLKGKSIGIIGNGATAVQMIPELQKIASKLVVFQRTANWVIPRDDAPISEARRSLYAYAPTIRRRYREQLMVTRESFHGLVADEQDPMHVFTTQWSLEHLEKQVPDPAMREKLTPHYPAGCKRIIISDDYYPAITSPNTVLELNPIERFTETGIKLKDGKHYEFDVIALATGFKTTSFLFPMEMIGSDGVSLNEHWQKQPAALLGQTVCHMPNFAMMYGPATNLGHNSIILMIEAQSEYITQLVRPVLDGRIKTVEPKASAMATYQVEIRDRLKKTVFSSDKCNSWYKNADGIVTNNWPGTVREYQDRTGRVDWHQYDCTGGNPTKRVPYKRTLDAYKVGTTLTALIAGIGLAAFAY